MKTKLLFLFSLILVGGNCLGQIMFQKVIRGGNYSRVFAVQQTMDSGYILTGYITRPDSNGTDVLLIKTNEEGNTLWTKTFGGTSTEAGYSVVQTTDSGYIIAASSGSFGQNGDMYVIKTNAIGDTLWTKAYGGTNADGGYFMRQTNDGGYIISGGTRSFGAGGEDIYLLKTDAVGAIQWTKTYGGINDEQGDYITQTSDSGYIICGYTKSFGAGDADVYLIKTKANGDTLWTKTYGGANDEYGNAVQQTSDGGYIITGFTGSFGAGNDDVYLIKTNLNGDTLWTKTYGGTDNDYGNDVRQASDGGYIISGITASFGAGASDVYLIKTDTNGNVLWTKTYGGTGNDYAYSVGQTMDEGYVMAGATNSFLTANDNSDVYLIKTDANGNNDCYQGNANTIVSYTATHVASTHTVISSGGSVSMTTTVVGSADNDSTLCLSVGIKELSINNTISIYPNPVTDQLIIDGNWKTNKTMKLTIYNISGKTIHTEVISSKQESINCSPYPAGVYFIIVADENKQWVGRFVKE